MTGADESGEEGVAVVGGVVGDGGDEGAIVEAEKGEGEDEDEEEGGEELLVVVVVHDSRLANSRSQSEQQSISSSSQFRAHTHPSIVGSLSRLFRPSDSSVSYFILFYYIKKIKIILKH